ncbi:MAG: prolipoprotein diacylglyceryl transferase [Lentisphaeria bacterium]|nr:prolipoprotein diacylglyceryl transferase [Lentisphaeria bacterium]
MLSPNAIESASLTIPWYSTMFAISTIILFLVLNFRAKEISLTRNDAIDVALLTIFLGLIGSRIWFVLETWDENFANAPFTDVFMIHKGGLVFYGGFMFIFIGYAAMAKVKKISIIKLFDFAGFAYPLAQGLGRIGCFLNGCCWGLYTQGPIAVQYPLNFYPHVQESAEANLSEWGMEIPLIEDQSVCLPVHPVQLYNTAANFISFIILFYFRKKISFKGGMFTSFIMTYSCLRFLTEFFRGDYAEYYAGLTIAQVTCLIVFPIGLTLHIIFKRRSTQEIEKGLHNESGSN